MSSPRLGSLPQTSSNWSATYRVPCTYNMSGPGGRSTWALRGSKRRTFGVVKTKEKVNPFVDFMSNLDGPAKGLRAAVLSTDAGEKHFQKSLKEESNRFHYDYMKHVIKEEDLHDARVIHCEQGRNLIEK